MEKNYNDIEDFLTDESFRGWVRNPTPELDNHWESWIKANSDKNEVVDQARDFIQSLKFKEFEPDLAIKDEILKKLKQEPISKQRSASIWSGWYKVAAVLAVAVSLATLYFYNASNAKVEQLAVEGLELIQKSNPVGIKSQHMLSDGSKVFLNSESSIEYLKKFDGEKRMVKLTGEAYFEVTHDADRPFKVLINELEVEVLGTQFNVNANLPIPEIALVEGKVKLTNNSVDASIILDPGQMASFDKQRNAFLSSTFDTSYITGWKDGILAFKEASLSEVVEKLHVWYGIEITFSNQPKSADWSYTANFRNESLESVLSNMSMLRNFDYEIKNDSLILSFK